MLILNHEHSLEKYRGFRHRQKQIKYYGHAKKVYNRVKAEKMVERIPIEHVSALI